MFTNRFNRWRSDDQTATTNTDTHARTATSSNPDQKSSTAPMPVNKPDLWIYRIVVTALGSTIILCTVGAISLEINGKPTPSLVSSLGTGSLAAIAGLLVPSPIKR